MAVDKVLIVMSDDLFDRNGNVTFDVRHGEGILTLRGGQPDEATGCLLPDGAVTDAICLGAHGDEQVWARKIGTNDYLYRRGRLVIEPDAELRFVDDANADVSVGHMIARSSLERDLFVSPQIQHRVTSKLFALLLYLALHGTAWRHDDSGEVWSCSSTGTGEIIDRLRGDAGFAMWYSLSYEQALGYPYLDEDVVGVIAVLGWTPIFDETGAA